MKRVIVGKLSLVYDSFILLAEPKTLQNGSREQEEIVVTKETWDRWIWYFPKYRYCRQATDTLFTLLGDTNKTYLTKCEFMKVADLLSMPLYVVTDSLHFFERHAWFYFSNRLADFIEGKIFRISVAFLIVINSVCITFVKARYVELFFSFMFLLEILLRIYIAGFRRFFRGLWNLFDFSLIFLAFIFWFVENTHPEVRITFTMLFLRNLRLLKLLRGVSSYLHLLHILGMLLPTMMSLMMIVFSCIVLYVCFGTWVYHGLFYSGYSLPYYMMNSSNCNNTSLDNSDFGKFHYCILSFNSFVSSFVLLCSVSIGNNWHVLIEGYALASGQVILTRIFFSTFKAIITYLLLLIVAFVLDIFLLAYKQKGSLKIEESVGQKLTDTNMNFLSYKDIRVSRGLPTPSLQVSSPWSGFQRVVLQENNRIWFRIKVKGARSVEYVSQAMFQSEVESELRSVIKYKHFFEAD